MKVLCLGNGDNVGIRTYLWLKDSGVDVSLYRFSADEDSQRGNPYFYISKEELDADKNVYLVKDSLLNISKIALFSDKRIEEFNKCFDVVLVTGGIHALIFSYRIKLPKIFIPVGYEIHWHAKNFRGFPPIRELLKNPRGVLRNHFYSWLTRKSMLSLDKIIDWFPPTVAVNKSLGLENKILYMSFGEDLVRTHKMLNKNLLESLNKNHQNVKKVFLWFSRLNFTDPTQANYKGADLFIKSLENFEQELKSETLVVYMGKHGVEVKEFMNCVSNSPIFPYIRWVDHLDYPDLLAYLSIRNGVLYTDFGDVNAGISGIGRDGYTMGIPMVNSTTNEIMIKQYTKPGPRFYAKELHEIKDAMNFFLNINENDFKALQENTLKYGQQYIDKNFFLKRIIKELKSLKDKSSSSSNL